MPASLLNNVTEAVALVIFAIVCVAALVILHVTHTATDDADSILSGLAFVAIGGGAGVARQAVARR